MCFTYFPQPLSGPSPAQPVAAASDDELIRKLEAQAKQIKVCVGWGGYEEEKIGIHLIQDSMAASTSHPVHHTINHTQMQQPIHHESFGKLEGEQERRAAAAEAMVKNYALKLDVVKQVRLPPCV